MAYALGLVAVLGAAAITVSRLSGSTAYVPVLLTSFTPYATAAYAIAALLLLITAVRRRSIRLAGAGALAAAAVALHTVWLVPLVTADAASASASVRDEAGTPVRVLSVNLRMGGADPDDLAGVIREVDPDILVLLEVAQPVLARLDDVVPPDLARVAGGGDRLDSEIFSRFASPGAEELGLTLGGWRTELSVGGQVVQTFGVHPFSPALRPEAWRDDHASLRELVVATTGPALVVGDLNAVPDHPPMRELAAAGVRDAAELAGEGLLPTFPAHPIVPPLIAIDHVLVRGPWTVRGVATHRVAGTDHLGVSADLVLGD